MRVFVLIRVIRGGRIRLGFRLGVMFIRRQRGDIELADRAPWARVKCSYGPVKCYYGRESNFIMGQSNVSMGQSNSSMGQSNVSMGQSNSSMGQSNVSMVGIITCCPSPFG